LPADSSSNKSTSALMLSSISFSVSQATNKLNYAKVRTKQTITSTVLVLGVKTWTLNTLYLHDASLLHPNSRMSTPTAICHSHLRSQTPHIRKEHSNMISHMPNSMVFSLYGTLPSCPSPPLQSGKHLSLRNHAPMLVNLAPFPPLPQRASPSLSFPPQNHSCFPPTARRARTWR